VKKESSSNFTTQSKKCGPSSTSKGSSSPGRREEGGEPRTGESKKTEETRREAKKERAYSPNFKKPEGKEGNRANKGHIPYPRPAKKEKEARKRQS